MCVHGGGVCTCMHVCVFACAGVGRQRGDSRKGLQFCTQTTSPTKQYIPFEKQKACTKLTTHYAPQIPEDVIDDWIHAGEEVDDEDLEDDDE